MSKVVVVTGTNGGIGKHLVAHLQHLGFEVFGLDKGVDLNRLNLYINLDLHELVESNQTREKFIEDINNKLNGKTVHALVNNAATQILGTFSGLTPEDLKRSLYVNAVAPFILSQTFLEHLEFSKGTIVNIGSIHSTLSKSSFLAYSTSKAALDGLTRAMAIEIGEAVRVVGINPAAINTEMLAAGFAGKPKEFAQLCAYHPVNDIGSPLEVAELVGFLLEKSIKFLNGSIINIDGGIRWRLHDPV